MFTFFAITLSVLILGINNMFLYAGYTIPAICCILIISIAIIIDLSRNRTLCRFKIPILLGYFWRLSLLFFDIYGRNIFILPNSGGDSEGFFRSAVIISQGGNADYGGAFSFVMGHIFRITGPSRVVGQYIVVLFSIVSLIVLAKTLIELKIEKKAINSAMYVAALLPNFAILSSIFLRESIIAMLCTISLYYFAKWMSRKRELYYILAILFPVVGTAFHSGVIGISVGMALIRLLYKNEQDFFGLEVKNVLMATVLLVAFAYVYLNYGEDLLGRIFVQSVDEIAKSSSEGGSSYAAYVGNSESIASMIIFTIPRYIYYLFSPFPWQWRGLSDIIAFLFNSLFYLFTIFEIIRYIKRSGNYITRVRLIAFLLVTLCVAFIFAWGVSNTGTAIRHRDKIFLWFVAMYAMSHDDRRGVHLK